MPTCCRPAPSLPRSPQRAEPHQRHARSHAGSAGHRPSGPAGCLPAPAVGPNSPASHVQRNHPSPPGRAALHRHHVTWGSGCQRRRCCGRQPPRSGWQQQQPSPSCRLWLPRRSSWHAQCGRDGRGASRCVYTLPCQAHLCFGRLVGAPSRAGAQHAAGCGSRRCHLRSCTRLPRVLPAPAARHCSLAAA